MLLIALLIRAPDLAAQGAAPVEVRAAIHPEFARLVLEWPAPVSVVRRVDAGKLVLHFDRPFEAQLDAAAARLGDYLAGLRVQDRGRALEIELAPGMALGRFRQFEPELVVLDFMEQDALPEVADGEVSVRTGEHEAYRRLVLDFSGPVVHRLERDGRQHILTFDRTVSIDAQRLASELRALVEEFAPYQGTRPGVIFRLRPEVESDVFALDEDKIVVDFQTSRGLSESRRDPGVEAATTGGDRSPRGADGQSKPAARERPVQGPGGAGSDEPVSHAGIERRAGDVRPPPVLLRPQALVPVAPKPEVLIAGGTERPSGEADGEGRSEAPPAEGDDLADDEPGSTPPDDADEPTAGPVAGGAEKEHETQLALARTPRGVELTAIWPEPVAAAVFSRAGVLWVVFDGEPGRGIELPALDPSLRAFFGELQLHRPVDGVLVLRFPLKRDLVAEVEDGGTTWRVLIRPVASPPTPLEIVRLEEPRRLRIRGADGGRWIRMADPLVGDQLVIWPLFEPVRGVDEPRSLVQLELLETAHGAVIREVADGLEIDLAPDGLEIAAAGGLHLSLPEAETMAGASPAGRREQAGDDERAGSSGPPGLRSADSEVGERPPGGPAADRPETLEPGEGQEEGPGDGAGPPSDPAGERPGGNRSRALAQTPRGTGRPAAAVPDGSAAMAAAAHDQTAAPGVDGPAAERSVPGEATPLPTDRRALGLGAFTLAEGDSIPAQRARLMRRIEQALEPAKNTVRLDLARFFLAQAMAAETLSVLDGVAPGDHDQAPLALARQGLAGAAELLMGRLRDAERALNVPGLDGDPEVALWRAAVAAANNDWAAAARELGRSEDTLAGYPPPLQLRLGMPAAMIALEAGDPEQAFAILDQVGARDLHPRDRAQLDFVRGLAQARVGAIDDAARIWRRVAAGSDEETRIKAEYALASTLFNEDRIAAEEALARLLPARPLWRGHAWEVSMLDGLAAIQAASGDPAAAIRTWQEALRLHPAAAAPLDLDAKIDQAFRQALAGPDPDPLAAVRALALYRDHPDLLPAGREGRDLRRALAERLADLDLLEPASALMRDVLDGSPGVDAAQDGAMLASLELREPDPGTALNVLDSTTAPDLPADLAAERRILRARSLEALGRADEALRLLADRPDPASRALLNDILWRQRDWRRLAASLEASLAEADVAKDGLSLDEQAAVVKLAIAHGQLEGDGLSRVKQRFGPAMRGRPAEPAFLMATSPARRRTAPDAILAAAERQMKDIRAYLAGPGLP